MTLAAESLVTELDSGQCWAALSRADLGRLIVLDDGIIEVFPINYLVSGESILFRSAPGTKMLAVTRNPEVTFEVDGEEGRVGWSVVLRGTAERLDDDDEIRESGLLGLRSASPVEKNNFVRVSATSITGRLFRRSEPFPRRS